MVAAFDVADVNPNPARFDQKKAEAINAEHIRLLAEDDFTARLRAYFDAHGHDTGLDDAQFAEAARAGADPHRRARRRVGSAEVPRRRRASCSTRRRRPRTRRRRGAGARGGARRHWSGSTTGRRPTSRTALKVGADRQPRAQAAQGVRPAPGGRHRTHVSPPLFESMELLGRDRSLARLRAGRDRAAAAAPAREIRREIFGNLHVGPA